ncbi:MAG: toxic anion resistance protein [Tissierellia bacterium]|nr:toxic anion resistance protein [Tissierellia bacterium]
MEDREIKLTLDGSDTDIDPLIEKTSEEAIPQFKQEIRLSPEEEKMVEDFAQQIDLSDSNIVLQYGVGAQKKIVNFSDKTLETVRSKDLGEVGKLLSDVVTELKAFDEEETKGIMGLFKKGSNKIQALKAGYNKAEQNVDEIARVLEGHQVQLMKDISMLDQMYDLNQSYFKELTMYIMAGEKKLQEVRKTQLPSLRQEAQEAQSSLLAQQANDLENLAIRFEKKLHDLDLTRMVSLQMAPQIRMVQSSNTVMAEKIQSTVINTIPIWKNQMVLALGVHHTQEAAKAQKAVTDFTNDLLKKNADTLKMSTVETARATERGVVDLDTLRHTNQQLITALQEVRQIQAQGHENRLKASQEIRQMEEELKKGLLG